jgi:NAD(P)-dependent dehydrogenase (short-subunit alcohol dehydrogenase family)
MSQPDFIASMFSLNGKLVVVTGASSGLGHHFATLLAQAGAAVAVVARRVDKLQQLVDRIQTAGGQAQAFEMDVSDPASVRQAFARIVQWHGVPDVVINNAGVTVTKSALEQTPEDYDQVLDTNLKGCWLVATEAARHMVAAKKGGSIVNVASILGERVAGGVAPYAISKAGVVQATKALALELARHNIRVNALLPGYVVTDLNRDFLASEAGEKLRSRIPSRRFSEMSDLDGPMLLLASGASMAMTGATVAVDGGHLVNTL